MAVSPDLEDASTERGDEPSSINEERVPKETAAERAEASESATAPWYAFPFLQAHPRWTAVGLAIFVFLVGFLVAGIVFDFNREPPSFYNRSYRRVGDAIPESDRPRRAYVKAPVILDRQGKTLLFADPRYSLLDNEEELYQNDRDAFREIAGPRRGRVRVFRESNGQWKPMGQPIVGETEKSFLGESADLSPDGKRLVVTDNFSIYGGNLGGGRARLFDYSEEDDEWKLVQGAPLIHPSPGCTGLGLEVKMSQTFRRMALQCGGETVVSTIYYKAGVPNRTVEAFRQETNYGNLGVSQDGDMVQIGNLVFDRVVGGEDEGTEWSQRRGVAQSPMSADGSTIAEIDNENLYGPAIQVYRYIGQLWKPLGPPIFYPEMVDGEEIRYSPDQLSFSQHGNRFVVGDAGWRRGGYIQAYVFDGLEWQPQGNSIQGDSRYDGYGYVVSMAPDGQSFVQYEKGEIMPAKPATAQVFRLE